MRGRSAYIFLPLLAGACVCPGLLGCGKSGGEPLADQTTTADEVAKIQADASDSAEETDAAASVVRDFLQAIKTGDETISNELLTPLARQKTAELDMAVAPMGSETATFTVGEVELPAEGGGDLAHVASTWTDIDDDGQEHTDEILWVLRREDEGWRIGGMATKVFEDRDPLLLDFEDPEDMRRKQQFAEAEMERRARAAVAAEPEETSESQEVEETAAVPSSDKRQAVRPSRPTRNK